MRVLVCGDRKWDSGAYLYGVLDAHHAINPIACIIEGEAPGADKWACYWAISRGVTVEPHPADWAWHGKSAGAIRNVEMLKQGKPDLVLAFHAQIANSKGTAHMIHIARKAHIDVRLFKGE